MAKKAVSTEVGNQPKNYKEVAGDAWAYARQNPARATAITLIGGAVLGGLLASRIGRRVLKASAPIVLPMASKWVGERISFA